MADARAAVGEALGIEIPASLNIRIVEESADEVVLVIPAVAAVVDLDDSELESTEGAGWCKTSFCSAGSCSCPPCAD